REILRQFVGKCIQYIPCKVINPLSQGTTFHDLPSTIKLWIFSKLQQSSRRKQILPLSLGKDGADNQYFLAGRFLYIECGNQLKKELANETETSNYEEWTSLENYLRQKPTLRLLVGKNDDYKEIITIMRLYGEAALASNIEEKTREFKPTHLSKIEEMRQRKEFESRFGANTMRVEISEDEEEQVPQITRQLGRIDVNAPASLPIQSIAAHQENDDGNQSWNPNYPKCSYHPRCASQLRGTPCPFNHPSPMKCRDYKEPPSATSCKDLQCHFSHPTCPNDGNCNDKYTCPYDHYTSTQTLINIHNSKKRNAYPNEGENKEEKSRWRNPSHSMVSSSTMLLKNF
ncbi:hypothetical protein PFISCL1PPCAC_1146, partial [Pristionchus fissidentatus]